MDGTGKATVVGLACYITSCTLFRLTLYRGYDIIDFREELKKVFKMAGVQGKNVVFLLTDSDIVKVRLCAKFYMCQIQMLQCTYITHL